MASRGTQPLVRKLTHRDLDDTPDDGNRYEVIDGELFVSPFPTFRHQRSETRLIMILGSWVGSHDLGEVFAAGLKVVLDEPTGVGPDVVFISKEKLSLMEEDGFYGAPDLLVEVLPSEPDLDRKVKFEKYSSAGVPYYWMIDSAAQTLWAYKLVDGQYRLEAEKRGDDVFEPELFPGLVIELRDLWK